MQTSEFDYHLPEELVAQSPAPRRGDSRLMVLDRGAHTIADRKFADFPSLLRSGDLLILNDTKVLRARLLAVSRGKKLEILLLEKQANGTWSCLAGPGRNARAGDVLEFEGGDGTRARVTGVTDFGGRILEFEGDPQRLMQTAGKMPLPPYLRTAPRDDQLDDERYQTVFAREPGAVAAPTAALHFTSGMLERVAATGVEIHRVTLHVGLGTFRPVKTERVEDHVMHEEKFCVPAATADAIRSARAAKRRVIAVGTTVVRALESFEAASLEPDRWHSTRLFLTPGAEFRVVNALLTNFHLPRSTLLMLACAFAGREFLMRAYAEAIRLKYRFYSYGDAMFIQ